MSRIPTLVLFALFTSCRTDKVVVETGQTSSETGDTAGLDLDEDGDGFTTSEDCDDGNAEVNPDATELCDDVDNDCDGTVDEDDAEDATTWYLDADGDGFGNEEESLNACEQPSGHVEESAEGFDCNDSDAAWHPGADESDCTDPNDYNCDGSVAYEDADKDGYPACEDCNDGDGSIHPDATEICDEVDNDCDGAIDDDDEDLDLETATYWYLDADGDGFGDEEWQERACLSPSGFVAESAEGFDCDDTDDRFYPGADESDCADPNDYNCDGSVAYEDLDADGWAACEECDDSNADVHPDASEICDEIDNDCDGDVDDDDASLDSSTATTWYADADADGFGDADTTELLCEMPSGYGSDDTDCDDTDDAVNPDATEICNEIDDDCDGDIDDADASLDSSTATTWYADSDSDGFGDADTTELLCEMPSGYCADDTDCDDTDSAVNPDATEICNDIDDDCDGDIDDEDDSVDLLSATSWYADADFDGYGEASSWTLQCDAPSGYIEDDTDCDDTDSAVNPAATEICNEIDDDCDSAIDDEDSSLDSSTATTWYADADSDGFGDADTSELLCDMPSGYGTDDTDCDDTDSAVNPDATEICNGIDDDCDEAIDDADDSLDDSTATTWYADADSDGFGDADTSELLCDVPSGYLEDGTDCDDSNDAVNPDATEICNEIDDDCNGDIDDDDSGLDSTTATTWYADADSDGFGDADTSELLCESPSGYLEDDTDCDDTDSAVNPDATEICNEIDDDCDEDIDDEDDSLDDSTATTWYADADSDGFGDADTSELLCESPSGYVADNTDCDDSTSDVNPAATETCNDIDDDCDGDIDDDDSSLDSSTASTWYADADADDYGDADTSELLCESPSGYVADATDCDDSNSAVNPAATETCNDIDDDCDGDIDDDDSSLDSSTASTWYADADSDGFGDPDNSTLLCDMPSGYVVDSSDCDDTDADTWPGANDYCDGVDADCDGTVDEDDSVDASTWYADADGDGYGDVTNVYVACSAPSGYGSDDTDCDDADSNSYPGGSEVCDGADNDCDGSTDEGASDSSTWYLDADGDGYGESSSTTTACDEPTGYSDNDSDCDDGNSDVNPGASEQCQNDTDEDCDGDYSEGCSSTFVSCGGDSAMDPGQSHSCSIGSTVPVDTVYISVGCNDGETGSYTVYFDDGSSETMTGSCGSTHSISQRMTNSMTIYMNSGGGGDSHISFTCCGSGGWGVYYK